ncbi:hypothetical protein REPUB_Repub08aG0165800 [Reevesia pubescens]
MAASITLPTLQGSLLRSQFHGQNLISHRPNKSSFPVAKQPKTLYAKFDLFEILGDEESFGSTGIAVPEDAFERELMGLTGGFPGGEKGLNNGIVQRITDGKAGVLFEGGNWDTLITFRLDQLERREKDLPMKSPKSVVLEAMLEKDPK